MRKDTPTPRDVASHLNNNTVPDAIPSEIVTRLYDDDETRFLLQAVYEQSGEAVDLNQFRTPTVKK